MWKRILLPVLLLSGVQAQAAEDVLTGDVKLACEAILCLSTSSRPSECSPPIRRYLSIKHRRMSSTINARRDFLKLCPSSDDEGMPELINAIAVGAEWCDGDYLVGALNRYERCGGYSDDSGDCDGPQLSSVPAHCNAYADNPYTALSMPVATRTACDDDYARYYSEEEVRRCPNVWALPPPPLALIK